MWSVIQLQKELLREGLNETQNTPKGSTPLPVTVIEKGPERGGEEKKRERERERKRKKERDRQRERERERE